MTARVTSQMNGFARNTMPRASRMKSLYDCITSLHSQCPSWRGKGRWKLVESVSAEDSDHLSPLGRGGPPRADGLNPIMLSLGNTGAMTLPRTGLFAAIARFMPD